VSKVEDITYTWTRDATTDYGLLADILEFDNYYELTGIDTHAIPNEPVSYNPTITNATLTQERKRKEEEWGRVRTTWFIRKGLLKAILDNLCDALDKQYYCQLKHCLTAYHNITPFQILEHLNNCWCPLDVQAKKELHKAYYSKWDSDEHLTAFGNCLDDDQKAHVRSDITIPDNNKLKFYLKEIYGSNKFHKQDMLTWEQLPAIINTNFDQTKAYFKKIVKAVNVYKQNTGGNSVQCNKYKSANQMADYGNKLREWIQQIASNGANNKLAANTQATKKIASSRDQEADGNHLPDGKQQQQQQEPQSQHKQWQSLKQTPPPRMKNHTTWADIATPMASTPSAPTTPVQTAVGKRTATRMKQLRPTPSKETHSGHLPSTSQSISKTMPLGRANQLPLIDRDRGLHYVQRMILIQLHLTQ
jgi:hypothetical protein